MTSLGRKRPIGKPKPRTSYGPLEVIPKVLGDAVADLPAWFVIGGNAVRCFCPYRPTRDVDFGVTSARSLADLLGRLRAAGKVEILEKGRDTVHLRYNGVNVSVFVLERLKAHVKERRLTLTGILATKLHAILDRGARRDFFDLYVTLQIHRAGLAECFAALREVYGAEARESLLLRALSYFDDAEREMPLPGEGPDDWNAVKAYFLERVGGALVPPSKPLDIQRRVVDVRKKQRSR